MKLLFINLLSYFKIVNECCDDDGTDDIDDDKYHDTDDDND